MVLLLGIVLLPLRAVAAATPALVVYDAAAAPSAMTWIEGANCCSQRRVMR